MTFKEFIDDLEHQVQANESAYENFKMTDTRERYKHETLTQVLIHAKQVNIKNSIEDEIELEYKKSKIDYLNAQTKKIEIEIREHEKENQRSTD